MASSTHDRPAAAGRARTRRDGGEQRETPGRKGSTNGAGASRPAPKQGGHPREDQGGITGLIARRAANWNVEGPNVGLMRRQRHAWNLVMDHYFRMEMTGWERLPDEPSLMVGCHSGGSLTMDAWTFGLQWWRRFEADRILHPTAHDVLMATPGLGDYFRAMGVIPPTRQAMGAAFDAGHDVILWPGGEQDSMRSWRRRDEAVLAGRKGFVKFAISRGVPIVPVATVGGHDTVFVLSEGRWLADALDRVVGLKSKLRGVNLPIIAGLPVPLAIETIPAHLPLPAKIRTALLEPIEVDNDPERVKDDAYVDRIYSKVERAIQRGMDQLAARRSFPIFG